MSRWCSWDTDDCPCVCIHVHMTVSFLTLFLYVHLCLTEIHIYRQTHRTHHNFKGTLLKQKWLFIPCLHICTCLWSHQNNLVRCLISPCTLFRGVPWLRGLPYCWSSSPPTLQEFRDSQSSVSRNGFTLWNQCILPKLLLLISSSVILPLFLF